MNDEYFQRCISSRKVLETTGFVTFGYVKTKKKIDQADYYETQVICRYSMRSEWQFFRRQKKLPVLTLPTSDKPKKLNKINQHTIRRYIISKRNKQKSTRFLLVRWMMQRTFKLQEQFTMTVEKILQVTFANWISWFKVK